MRFVFQEPPPPVVSEPVPPEEASLPPVRIVEEKDREPQVVPVRGDTCKCVAYVLRSWHNFRCCIGLIVYEGFIFVS